VVRMTEENAGAAVRKGRAIGKDCQGPFRRDDQPELWYFTSVEIIQKAGPAGWSLRQVWTHRDYPGEWGFIGEPGHRYAVHTDGREMSLDGWSFEDTQALYKGI